MKNFKVSVIIPIYNVEKYLERCVNSIENQTYNNLEIILIDDGSSDNSSFICDELKQKDSRIKVIHQKNQGVSNARNHGIEISTGDYICFIDGDDFAYPNYVEYLLDIIIANNADAAITTEAFSNFNTKENKKEKIKVITSEEAIEFILCYKTLIGVNSKMFNGPLLRNKVRFNTELVIGEGFNFNIDFFKIANNIVVSNKKIYFYRKDNPKSVTTKYSNTKWQNGLYAVELIKKKIKPNQNKLNKSWEYANWRTHSDIYDLLIITKKNHKYTQMFKKCKKIIRKGFYISLGVPINKKERLRAFIMMIYPKVIPFAMILRRKKYKIKI